MYAHVYICIWIYIYIYIYTYTYIYIYIYRHALGAAAVSCRLYGQFYPASWDAASEPGLSAAFASWFQIWERGAEDFALGADGAAAEVLGVMHGLAARDEHFGRSTIL